MCCMCMDLAYCSQTVGLVKLTLLGKTVLFFIVHNKLVSEHSVPGLEYTVCIVCCRYTIDEDFHSLVQFNN